LFLLAIKSCYNYFALAAFSWKKYCVTTEKGEKLMNVTQRLPFEGNRECHNDGKEFPVNSNTLKSL